MPLSLNPSSRDVAGVGHGPLDENAGPDARRITNRQNHGGAGDIDLASTNLPGADVAGSRLSLHDAAKLDVIVVVMAFTRHAATAQTGLHFDFRCLD